MPFFSPLKKFLFVSYESLAVDLAWHIRKEGHVVRFYTQNQEDKDVGDGFIEKVSDWKAHIEWADVIVFDDVGFGEIADELRREGKLVVGGSAYTDRLEMDREFGQSEMKQVGLGTLAHWDFDDFDSAILFLKNNPGRYVFKPSEGEIDWHVKNLLSVGQDDDGLDIIEMLEKNKKTWSRNIKRFQLQKFASGIEIAVGAFFNGFNFIRPININFEHKKLFPGDSGPPTGEMGTLMFWVPHNHFAESTLLKMEERLRASRYVGYVDINCIVNAKGIFPLEFTTRFGYPTISIQMEGILSPLGEFLWNIAVGHEYQLKVKTGFQVGVVIAIPPFPYVDERMFQVYKDTSVVFKKPQEEGFHLGDVKLVDGDWKIAGKSGYVMVVTGANSTVENARKHAYRRIQNIKLQNMFFRTDIGQKWYHESDQLHTWGIL